jgi:hypothetical protein
MRSIRRRARDLSEGGGLALAALVGTDNRRCRPASVRPFLEVPCESISSLVLSAHGERPGSESGAFNPAERRSGGRVDAKSDADAEGVRSGIGARQKADSVVEFTRRPG